ncbi:caspase family protein [Tolypothrix sp. NIES-4075]|uniref:caspase family protein n=1 Tax=Tolypothrix sp. NIES-4075 TaxID=2005459 RepID=UPI000B5C9A4B|nr:caspase family protein [Tolypothrix sp. NIES-4075]
MKRRTFLQRIGFILAALGVTEAGWLSLGNRYYQALAQPSRRKLALLIGINKYPQNLALGGCLTDVELQKELLIYRFGFQESDILTLTDEQATREKIESAFLDHLVEDAKASDVIVFHFSGYGSRIKLNAAEESLVNTLIPFDGTYISENNQIVNCLLEETLMLLWRQLPAQVTAILDTSYHAPITAPSTASRIRAYQMPAKAEFATAELDFQKELKSKSISDRPLGLLLGATSNPKELAREILLSGFSVGLFTYALTQYLWEATPATTIIHTLSQVGSSIRQLDGKQQPALLNSKENQSKLLSDNFVTESIIGAQGVITATEEDGKTVQVWLGGIPLQVLEYYGVNSRLSLVSKDANIQIVLRSRNGLTAKAQIFNETKTATPIKVGQLVQEEERVLPKNINLSVALDTKLERIERVDATSGFATISHVSSVIAGEQPADYVFGKLPETKLSDSPGSPSRYGLFSLSCELIPNTAGEDGEAAKVAVQRLGRRLQTLLAAKLWRLTENEGSSRLAVKASLEIISGITPRSVMQRETVRVTATSKKLLSSEGGYVPSVSVGSRMQYRVENLNDRPIYLMLLGLNSSRTAIAFYPTSRSQELNAETKPPLKEIVIAPGEIITLPKSATNSEWVIPGSADEYEHQLIFSTAPFTQTLAAVQAAKYSTADKQPIIELSKPLEVAQALLQDLHNASAAKETTSQSTDFYAFDVNNWASLSFIFQVV